MSYKYRHMEYAALQFLSKQAYTDMEHFCVTYSGVNLQLKYEIGDYLVNIFLVDDDRKWVCDIIDTIPIDMFETSPQNFADRIDSAFSIAIVLFDNFYGEKNNPIRMKDSKMSWLSTTILKELEEEEK